MNDFLKHKFYRKLFSLLRFKRHARLRSSLSYRLQLGTDPVLVSKQPSLFFLKRSDFSSFFFEPLLSSSLSSSFFLPLPSLRFQKHKFHLHSFLFSSLCHFSRKRPSLFFDSSFFRTYYTIPYRLSLTRFLTYRVLLCYYSTLRVRFLSSLRKLILSRSFRSSFRVHSRSFVKNFLFSLESRLDSSLFRLFHFKSLFTLKRSSLSVRSSGLLFRHVKSPFKTFSTLQIKQQLNHGHFLLNGHKIHTNHTLSFFDSLSFTSFLSNPFWFGSSFFFSQLSSSFPTLFLFRHFSSLSSHFSFWQHFFHSPVLSEVSFLCQHFHSFHLKRFTELFFLSYNNFHLFSRLSSSPPSFLETLLKPFVSSFSSSQSLFFFWPLLSLLSFVSWGPSLQRTFVLPSRRSSSTSTFSHNLLQKNLHDLFLLKKLQTQLFSSSSPSSSPSSSSLFSHFLFFSSLHPSLFSVPSLFCYASLLYGTRKCKWVSLQQRKSSFFFSHFYHKVHFFQLELDFFQLSFRLSSFF